MLNLMVNRMNRKEEKCGKFPIIIQRSAESQTEIFLQILKNNGDERE